MNLGRWEVPKKSVFVGVLSKEAQSQKKAMKYDPVTFK